MVAGIDKFREFFKDYPDHYAIIGGAACDILFDAAGLPFRATKDIDMVLCIEVVDAAFGEMFRDFLNAGGYEAREQSSGHREFYRFHKPKDKGFPFMLELFSKEPDKISLPDDTGIVRLAAHLPCRRRTLTGQPSPDKRLIGADEPPPFQKGDLLVYRVGGLSYNIKEAFSMDSRRPQRSNPSVLGKLAL